jgi:hypothetical protein
MFALTSRRYLDLPHSPPDTLAQSRNALRRLFHTLRGLQCCRLLQNTEQAFISTGVRNANLLKWRLTRLLWLFGSPYVEYRELVNGF